MKESPPVDRTGENERLARIEHTIDESRALQKRQLLDRTIKLWRSAEAREALADLEKPDERVSSPEPHGSGSSTSSTVGKGTAP